MSSYNEVILTEWQKFINQTPKDINWLIAFEKFRETEPYKTAFDKMIEEIHIQKRSWL